MVDEKTRDEAEILGKAMRFGAMMWMNKDDQRSTLRWFPKKKILELWLPNDMIALFGEVAEARFNSLASSLGAEVHLRTGKS